MAQDEKVNYKYSKPLSVASNIPVRRRTFAGFTDIRDTEVVIIGNGPAGICLSYFLSGNWPYYSAEPHPNEILDLKLKLGGDMSIVQQDLMYLSDGLEGRSSSSVALLFDALTHPNADAGNELPSLLAWKYSADRVIPHVVLGKKGIGGIWQNMDDQMQTLSLGSWMQLVNMPFRPWVEKYRQKNGEKNMPNILNRATVDEVRSYYKEFVKEKQLMKNFQNNSTVTCLRRLQEHSPVIDEENGEISPTNNIDSVLWEICGFEAIVDGSGNIYHKEFCFHAPNVVLATGISDIPKTLQVQGERESYVLHSVVHLQEKIISEKLDHTSEPIVIIGSGLCAADAIIFSRCFNIPVVHMFRRDIHDMHAAFKQLPAKIYPEYNEIYQLMQGKIHDHNYQCYNNFSVVEFTSDNKVIMLCQKSHREIVVQASYVAVLIGTSPDLSFVHGLDDLGIVSNAPIDARHNPINVDPFTYQSVNNPGLYAMGPLVGDSFVRFIRGGALAITSHLWQKKEKMKFA